MPLYGKIDCLMDMIDLKEIPAPPRLIPALVAGFDAITNHILVILFPIIIDILIWFAPHLRIKNLVKDFIFELTSLSTIEGAELSEMIGVGQEAWLQVAEQYNLAIAFRSYPVGIPSLMATSMPLDTPLGMPIMVGPSVGISDTVLTMEQTRSIVPTRFKLILGTGLNWRSP